MHKSVSCLAPSLALFLMFATLEAASAQGRGATPIGRQGYAWQHGLDKAQEDLERLEADLARLPEEEWRAKALAWVRFEVDQAPKPSRVEIAEAFRVGGIAEDKRIQITRLGDELNPSWILSFTKKPPKKLGLVLTDEARTEITCIASTILETGAGLIGVFQYDGTLMCLSRPKFG